MTWNPWKLRSRVRQLEYALAEALNDNKAKDSRISKLVRQCNALQIAR